MIGEMSEVHRSQLEGTFPCWISDNVGFKINYNILQFSSVAQSCLTFCDHMDCSMPGLPVHRQFPENYPNSCPLSWWCHLTISSSLIPFSFCPQSFPTSGSFPVSQLFTSGGQSNGNFNTNSSNEYSGLISFRIEWFDLLAVQGTLKSLLQHHSSKARIFRCLAFLMVWLSYPYMTTGKTIASTRWTFVSR